MKFSIILSTLILATVAAQGSSFERDGDMPSLPSTGSMTLQECLDYAAAHNLTVRQQQIAMDRAEVDIYASQGQLQPSLSFNTNQGLSWRPWSQNYVNVSNGTMTQTSSELNYNGTYGLSAQWDVWNGGRSYKQVKRDKTALKQAEANAEASSLNIQEQIVEAYVRIIYQNEAVRINKEILESTRTQLQRTEEMVKVGDMARADLAQMQAQVSQCEYNVTNSETQLASYKLNLKQLLQIIDSEPFNIVVPDVNEAEITMPLPGTDEIYTVALQRRPEVKAAGIGIELAKIDIDLAKRQRYPTIGLSAGINTSNTSGMDQKFYTQWKTNLSNSIGLNLSVPIFDKRATSAAIKRARLSEQEAELSMLQTKTDLFNTIEQHRLDAVNAREQYLYAKSNVNAMQESYTLVSEQFDVGLKDVVDLTTSRNNLVQATQQLLQAKYTALLNRALLNFYEGQPIKL